MRSPNLYSPELSSITTGDHLGTILFIGPYRDATGSTGAMIRAEASGTFSAIDPDISPTGLQFYTQDATSYNSLLTPRMVITSEGNVGIGTSSPIAKTHILQEAMADAFRVDDRANDTTPFVIDQFGNVGINTSNPQNALEVDGDVWFKGDYFSAGNGTFHDKNKYHTKASTENYRIVFDSEWDNGTDYYFAVATHEPWQYKGVIESKELLRILENGNVGIATLDPTQKLHVNGSVRIRDHIYDSNNDPGTPGQILSATADGIDWIDAPDGELQDLWETIYSNDDSTSTTANSPTDTLYLDGQGIASVSITGDTVIITATEVDGSTTNEIQDLWETITSDSGSTIADIPTDTLNIYGAGIASTSISGDTLTITAIEVDGSTTNEIQDLWETITSDSGSTIADIPTDTLNIYGAGIASTSISGDTLTITAIEVDGSTTNELQNLFETMTDGTNNAVADSQTDVFKFRGGGIVTVAVTNDDPTHGDNVLISATEADGDPTNEIQDLWKTIYSNDDSTSTTANSPTDTLYIDGVGVSVSITGDTLTITQDTEDELQNLFEVYVHDGPIGNAVELSAANGDIRFYNDGASEMLFLDESSGRIGIGSTSPGAKLDVHANSEPAATIGHSSNSATGLYAIAMGYGTTASGWYSTAMGKNTTAIGGGSTAMGLDSTASYPGCTAMGKNTYANAPYSTAMGRETTTGGEGSTAMGYLTTASGDHSTAMGVSSTASAEGSTAMGEYTTASGGCSTAMGFGTNASGSCSTAMGFFTTASGYDSTAMGYRITAAGDYSFGIGLDTIARTITQDNTMAIMGGNVGIGTVSPTGKLDVNGNDIRIRNSQTPASASAGGNQGEICWDSDYIYVCVGTNTWKRAAISTW